MIVEPLVVVGADHLSAACPAPAGSATTAVGAEGDPTVTAPDASDSGPAPLASTALTVNVYVVPLVSPVATAAVWLAGNDCGVWAAPAM